jgi:hypothetical protein
MTWENLPILQAYAVLCAILVALGAVGRFGNASLGKCFWPDRLLVIGLAIGVAFSPALLYLCLIAACCLQYTVASWRLGPGYSNLLGFEWIRATACVLTACLAAYGWMDICGRKWVDFETLTLSVILGFQASTYVNHALAKSALGSHGFSWILENRVQCLVVNSWLRGWQIHLTKTTVLRIAAFVQRFRIPLSATVWLIEIGWLFLLLHHPFASVIIAATILMHLGFFLLSGIASYHYIASHCFFLGLVYCSKATDGFHSTLALAAAISIVFYAFWLGWLRPRILRSFRKQGSPGKLGKLVDAADHLMAWWDSPHMRMFSYTVQTESGETCFLPTPKLSPHDTALTDIHTHMMILGLHQDLDPAVITDRKQARTGVWGLVIDLADRNFLYEMMDQNTDPSRLKSSPAPEPWEIGTADITPQSAVALRTLFTNLQQDCFRTFLRWPHFPGEDFATDRCPIANLPSRAFDFKQPIQSITLWRIKTWFNGDDIQLIESSRVGIIHLNDSSNPA